MMWPFTKLFIGVPRISRLRGFEGPNPRIVFQQRPNQGVWEHS